MALAIFQSVGVWEILLLLLVLLLVFGPKRLPEMGRSLGHGMREFKDSITGAHPFEEEDDEEAAAAELVEQSAVPVAPAGTPAPAAATPEAAPAAAQPEPQPGADKPAS